MVVRSQVSSIQQALNQHPAQVAATYDSLKRSLARSGVDLDAYAKRKQGATQRHSLKMLTDGDLEDASDAEGSDGAGRRARTTATASLVMKRLDTASSKDLQAALTQIEPVVFGPAALKGLLKGNQRVVPNAPLLEVSEFCTGLAASDWAAVVGRMCELNEEKGRRGQALVLPPKWVYPGGNGVYQFQFPQAKTVMVVNTFTNRGRILPDAMLGGNSPKDLYIYNNYSEDSATIASYTSIISINEASIIAQQSVVVATSLLGPSRRLRGKGPGQASASSGEACCLPDSPPILAANGHGDADDKTPQDSQNLGPACGGNAAPTTTDESGVMPPPPPQ